MKTNTGLVEHAQAFLGHPYWYGTLSVLTSIAGLPEVTEEGEA